MANNQTTTTTQAVYAMLTLGFMVNVLYAGYIYFTETGLSVFSSFIMTSRLFNLELFNKNLSLSTFQGILAHSGLYSGIMMAITMLTAFAVFKAKSKLTKESLKFIVTKEVNAELSDEYLNIESDSANIVLKVKRFDDKTGDYTTETIHDPLPGICMKLSRSNLDMSRHPETPLEKLEAALINVLHSHREYPADPQGYHAKASIYDHSLQVATKLSKESDKHRLSRVIGLAHDIGKILTYKKKIDGKGKVKWEILSKQHDTLSAQIVRMLPEFKLINDSDKSTITTVLSYSHKPGRMPKRHTSQAEILLVKYLRESDGLATKEDRQSITDMATDPAVLDELAEALKKAILQLNINAIRDGNADGWTSDLRTFVGIKESVLREKLMGYLPQKLARDLGLVIDQREHPATPIILSALQKIGFYLNSYEGYTPSKGLFSVKVGRVSFHGVILLDRDLLEIEMPEIIESWGNCEYKFKVIGLEKS